jgi:hypothetical protein
MGSGLPGLVRFAAEPAKVAASPLQQRGAFQGQELVLGVQAAGGREAAGAVGRHHAVAGDDDRDRVGAAGLAHRPGDALDPPGELAVGLRGAVGDLAERAPDALLELSAARRQRQVEVLSLAGEVGLELRGGLQQQGRVLAAPPTAEHQAGDGLALREQGERTQRRCDRQLLHRRPV